LEKVLKSLIMLRLLEVPYRPGCPISAAEEGESLLASLYILCKGMGLMVLSEGGNPVYVVETDHGRFVEWIIARMTGLLGRNDRDKTVSDALWSALFPIPECGTRPERALSPTLPQSYPIQLSGNAFPGREAVLVRCPGLGEWVLVFESLWEMDRGGRVHRVVRVLPEGISPDQVWIWIPRRPSQPEAGQIASYMATARALRQVLSQESAGEMDEWTARALKRQYLQASTPALEGIVDCYRQGEVVTDIDTWRLDDHADSLVHLIERLVAWVGHRDEDASRVT